MSKKESYRRLALIVSKLKSAPANFQTLQQYLQEKSQDLEEDLAISIRTFQRDKEEIASLFDIEIVYDRSAKVYKIAYDGKEEHNRRLMETFQLFDVLKLSNDYAGQLLLENRKPLGTNHLHGLLHAIKNNYWIRFDYEKFSDSESTSRYVKPVAIKEAKNRWYLLADEDNVVKSFGLDRILNLDVSKEKYEPQVYDVEGEYKDCFGIINGTGQQPEKVLLSFGPTQGKYIKSLPLHHSQKLILETEEEVRFEYFIRPTHDFVMEILAHGNRVKVLEPKKLQHEVRRKLKDALAVYS